jgi:XTP/dITP diphosphohydrolase
VELIVLATRNPGKVRELERLLGGAADRFESLIDHPEIRLPREGADSYRENAHRKARAVFEALGIAAIGDDSGLEVDALGGLPGVRSARFAGEEASDLENNELLLARLVGVPATQRTARFRCALAFVWSGEESLEVEGVCEGTILDAPHGSWGFGYDPLFLPQGETRTFGELSASRKDSISHRARAAAVLGRAIRQRDWMRVIP